MGKIHREFDYQQRPATKEWEENRDSIKWDVDVVYDENTRKFSSVERKKRPQKEAKNV